MQVPTSLLLSCKVAAAAESGVSKNPLWKASRKWDCFPGVLPAPRKPQSPGARGRKRATRHEWPGGSREASVPRSRALLQPHCRGPTAACTHTAQGCRKVDALSGNQARLRKRSQTL